MLNMNIQYNLYIIYLVFHTTKYALYAIYDFKNYIHIYKITHFFLYVPI